MNKNKKPFLKRTVQEVESKRLGHDPLGVPIRRCPLPLAVAIGNLNARIGSCGASAREM